MRQSKRQRLADGRYLVQITPHLFHVLDEFDNKIDEVIAVNIELATVKTQDTNECSTTSTPASRPAR